MQIGPKSANQCLNAFACEAVVPRALHRSHFRNGLSTIKHGYLAAFASHARGRLTQAQHTAVLSIPSHRCIHSSPRYHTDNPFEQQDDHPTAQSRSHRLQTRMSDYIDQVQDATSFTPSSISMTGEIPKTSPFFRQPRSPTTHPPPGFIPSNDRTPRSKATIGELEEELKNVSENQTRQSLTSIKHLLRILVHDRKVKPAPQHYEALLLANCSPEEGSADNIARILDEMEDERVEITFAVYTAALQALAVHPSLHLVFSILAALKTRYMVRTPAMAQALFVALVRSDQLVLAQDLLGVMEPADPYWKWKELLSRGGPPLHLHVILLRAFVQRGDYEAVLRHIYDMQDRKNINMWVTPMFWAWLLRRAARDGERWITMMLWQAWVERMRVRPTRAMCVDVMKVAAKEGIPWLAESVSDVIKHCDWEKGSATFASPRQSQRFQSSSRTDVDGNKGNFGDFLLDKLPQQQMKLETHKGAEVGTEKASDSQAAMASTQPMSADGAAQNPNELTTEEEALVDQAYANSTPDPVDSFGGDPDFSDDMDDLPLPDTAFTESSRNGSRRRQVKVGNMWPYFRDIEGHGSPRTEPWVALIEKGMPDLRPRRTDLYFDRSVNLSEHSDNKD